MSFIFKTIALKISSRPDISLILSLFFIVILIFIINKRKQRIHNNRTFRSEQSQRLEYSSVSPSTNKEIRWGENLQNVDKVVFQEISEQEIKISANNININGLRDAFTGVDINLSSVLYQCLYCKVFYQKSSYDILVEANNKECVSCGKKNIVQVTDIRSIVKKAQHEPKIATLDNYKEYVGRSVTFEGYVFDVKTSKDGQNYAIMFEDKRWCEGFKMVIFRGKIDACGGKNFINNLRGKRVVVRGLLRHHPFFGYEIIVSQQSMILDVK